mgnify:CR=1 FL=1
MAQEEGIADQGSHPAAASGGGHLLSPCLGNKIPADKEIVFETELVNHAKFPVKPMDERKYGEPIDEVLDLGVAKDWKHAGLTLTEIPFPQGSVVGGIIRGDDVIIPGGETIAQAGDHMLVFAKREVLEEIARLFAAVADPVSEEPTA